MRHGLSRRLWLPGGRVDGHSVGDLVNTTRTTKARPPIVFTQPRPYLLTFPSGNTYPLTSIEADRLINSYPVIRATRHRVILRDDSGGRCIIRPATVGGGPAFVVQR